MNDKRAEAPDTFAALLVRLEKLEKSEKRLLAKKKVIVEALIPICTHPESRIYRYQSSRGDGFGRRIETPYETCLLCKARRRSSASFSNVWTAEKDLPRSSDRDDD